MNITSKIKKIISGRRGPEGSRGYALLFAVITSFLVLGVAAFILSVSRKQFILSSAARDSTYAIYAADSGIECSAENLASLLASSSESITISCNDQTISGISYSKITNQFDSRLTGTAPIVASVAHPAYQAYMPSPTPGPIVIYLPNPAAPTSCVKLIVTDGVDSVGAELTLVDARGYSLAGDGSCPIVHPRTVERAIRVTYR